MIIQGIVIARAVAGVRPDVDAQHHTSKTSRNCNATAAKVVVLHAKSTSLLTLHTFLAQHTYTRKQTGTSRSPAVVIAAIMKAKGLALQDALRVLKSRVPHAAPNPGFMAQLELWGEMGCQIDEGHPGYKQYLLAKVGRREVKGCVCLHDVQLMSILTL